MNYFLHKFRHTFATGHLRGGVDIRTVQAWLGHRDIKSTMVYLKGIQSKDAARINGGEHCRTALATPESRIQSNRRKTVHQDRLAAFIMTSFTLWDDVNRMVAPAPMIALRKTAFRATSIAQIFKNDTSHPNYASLRCLRSNGHSFYAEEALFSAGAAERDGFLSGRFSWPYLVRSHFATS